jgi:hypothetical protein
MKIDAARGDIFYANARFSLAEAKEKGKRAREKPRRIAYAGINKGDFGRPVAQGKREK